MSREPRARRSILMRDAALERLRRLNRALLAASLALTALLTDAAASSFPGTSRHGTSSSSKRDVKASRHAQSGSSTTQSLSPPSEAPRVAPSETQTHEGERSGNAETPPQAGTSTPEKPAEANPESSSPPQTPPSETHAGEAERTSQPERSEAPVVSGGS